MDMFGLTFDRVTERIQQEKSSSPAGAVFSTASSR
jgi:hypothetical protein